LFVASSLVSPMRGTLTSLERRADLAGGKIIKFGLESKRSVGDSSTEKFRDNLVAALREMRKVCAEGQVPASEAATAKL
jgi:carnitine O-acetyltransferase